jgi:hypothetical protein
MPEQRSMLYSTTDEQVYHCFIFGYGTSLSKIVFVVVIPNLVVNDSSHPSYILENLLLYSSTTYNQNHFGRIIDAPLIVVGCHVDHYAI